MIAVVALKSHTCTCRDMGTSQAQGVEGVGLLSVSPLDNLLSPAEREALLTGKDWGLDELDEFVDLNQ